MDVETVNAILKLLDEEIAKYPPESPESIALWKFKERLSQ